MKITNVAASLIIISIALLALIYGQSVLIPFIIALLIWFVVKKIRDLIDRVEFAKKYIPRWIKTLVATLLIFGFLLITGQLITGHIEAIVSSFDHYEPNIARIANSLSDTLNIDLRQTVDSFFDKKYFEGMLRSTFHAISGILSNLILILFYVLFLFIEERLFSHKMLLLFSDRQQQRQFFETMGKIDKMLASYISLKSLVSFITAALSFIVFLIIGVDSAFFWAVLIFVFNFIPSIGSIAATVLPALFSLIQFGEFWPFMVIVFVVGGIQVLVGNYVEPKLMGNTLNISPLVAIIALAVWGTIWGIPGMLLSVPITVALIIIFAQFPATRPVAILLSEKGRI